MDEYDKSKTNLKIFSIVVSIISILAIVISAVLYHIDFCGVTVLCTVIILITWGMYVTDGGFPYGPY